MAGPQGFPVSVIPGVQLRFDSCCPWDAIRFGPLAAMGEFMGLGATRRNLEKRCNRSR